MGCEENGLDVFWDLGLSKGGIALLAVICAVKLIVEQISFS